MIPKIKFTIPTYVTLVRFILVPLFVYFFVEEQYLWSLIVLIAAGLSDALDGFLARKLNMRSDFGTMLDPLADKFLMLLSLLALSSLKAIPWFLTVLVIFRDVGIVFGALFLGMVLKIKLYFKPTKTSKLATVSQITAIAFSFMLVFLSRHPHLVSDSTHEIFHWGQLGFVYLATLTTSITYFQYSYLGYKFCRYGERNKA